MNTTRVPLAALSLLAFAHVAGAQTVTVTTGADVIDVASTATLADLPGPDGKVSLAEAMIATNNTPGHQTVAFAIPQSDWTFQFLYPGRAVCTTSIGFDWRAFDQVTIDGTTQTAFTGDTHPDGAEVVLSGAEFYLNADGCVMKGFDSSSVTVTGSNGTVTGFTSSNLTLFDGSGSLVEGNTGGTIKIDRSHANLVVGNTVQRVRVLGGGSSSLAFGNVIGGPAPEDRNFITGYGTWNSEGLPGGTSVQLAWTAGTVIQNNRIGTTPDGMAQGSQASVVGVGLETENHSVTVRDNQIAGILGHGMGPHHAGLLYGWAVLLSGVCTDVAVVGNTIGLDATGAPTLGSVWGVSLGDAVTHPLTPTDVRIGGYGPGDGNVIGGHVFNGITVGPGVPAVRLAANELVDNGWLGIDLKTASYGVTPNDPLDADTGGNGLQNFPVLTAVGRGTSTVHVDGVLDSAPSTVHTLDFFASAACDTSGFGEGEQYLGSRSVTTGASGSVAFAAVLAAAIPSGWTVTATATAEPSGATSEFSACVPAVDLVCQQDLGFAGPGSSVLSLCGGDLSSGTDADLVLHDARPGSLAFLAVGHFSSPTPLFGGTVVPVPPGVLDVLVVDPEGMVVLPSIQGGMGPVTFYGQVGHLDPAQPAGWAFSNAIRADFLP